MDRTPLWKPVLIVLVLLFAGLMLYFPGAYGPKDRLKAGIDLAGGTTLVYQVNIPEDAQMSAAALVDEVIAIYSARVDPNGVRNLIWRPQAGNRIEIQMPVASSSVRERRQAFLEMRDDLLATNLSEPELQTALRAAGQQRRDLFRQIAGDNEDLYGRLGALADLNDTLIGLGQDYQSAEQLKAEAAAALEAAGDDPARRQAQARSDEALAAAIRMAARYNDVQEQYRQAQRAVFDANVDPDRLRAVLDLYDPNASKTLARQKFDEALAQLMADHPGRADQIRAVADAWTAYAAVKGPLDDPNDLIAMLRGSGVLEFRIGLPPDQIADLEQYRENLEQRGPRYGQHLPFRWFAIDDLEQFVDNSQVLQRNWENPQLWTEWMASQRGMVGQAFGDSVYLLLGNTPAMSLTRAQSDWQVVSAARSVDRNMLPAVAFTLNTRGGQLMQNLTREENQGRPMAILLDGKVMSAPSIRSNLSTNIEVSSPRGFAPREVDYLVRTLKAGATEGALSHEPISIKTTGPQLGQDNLRRGLQACVWSLIAVAGFMAVYYLLWGAVADFALAANVVLILGAMALFQGTFTLPGIAGIVLTIGMAVDANVLIFERIREETARGADLRTAVRLGFEKAFSTIIDANVTTMITCVVLYYTATAEIKGFALTLMIGILATLFTALFCAHVIVNLWIHLTGVRVMPMLPTLCKPIDRLLSPTIDWVRLRYVVIAMSVVAIIAGGAAVWARGMDMLDIEFRSGTKVTFELSGDHAISLAEARDRVSTAMPDTINSVVSVGTAQNGAFKAFSVSTLTDDSDAVSDAIKTAFADVLDVERSVHFAGMGDPDQAPPPVGQAPIYIVDSRSLGMVINRPEVAANADQYLGGVATVLDNLEPTATVKDIHQRIDRMRQSAAWEQLGYRPFEVIGLDLAEGSTDHYKTVAVLSRDDDTNYTQEPDRFTEGGGLADTEWRLIRDAMVRDTSLASVATFDPQVAGTMQAKAIQALALAMIFVVAYIWVRFGSLRYGLAAIAALVHDVLIALGLIGASAYLADSALGTILEIQVFRIDLALIAALLTIVGYSLNDTIVVFDRIRENRGKLAFASPQVINDSINQTISRTVLTSGTTLLAVFVLYVLGGAGVHEFAFAMFVGVVVGTYSSIAIAAPLLLFMGEWQRSAAARAKPSAV